MQYHEIKFHRLFDNKVLTLTSENTKLSYEAFVLGDFVVSFGISLKSGALAGEMCLHGGGTPAYIFDFDGNNVITRYTKEAVATLTTERTDLSVVYSVSRRRFDIYVNGVLTVKDYYVPNGIPINCDKLADFFITLAAKDESAEVELYDLLAHSTAARVEGAVVYDEHHDYFKKEKEVVLTDKNYLPKEEDDKALLAGAIAVHMRSGVIYRDGKKIQSGAEPYYFGKALMVSLSDFGTMLDDDENTALAAVSVTRGYVDLYDVAKALDRHVYYDDTTVHYGMVILTKGEFIPPSDKKSLQKLNDFLFFLRPDKEKLYKDYKASPLAGVHPRLVATEEDFERLRREIRENKHKARWFKRLLEMCEEIKEKPILRYELRDGVRLLFVSWDLQRYALVLALAYKLTGDRKYFDYAWPHLKACAEMPDWNPSHHIDVGTLAYGYAVAYDWFYDVMNEEQRRIMEKGAYENVFYTVNQAIESPNSPYCNILMDNNHNVFCNAGVMATVLAFMDVYPEVASKIGADIIRVIEKFMDKFAPMGAYYEGPYYAETAINYTVRIFSAIKPTLGTLYGLDKAQGFDMIADFVLLLQSDVAPFNFADSSNKPQLLCISGMFWIFDHFGKKGRKESTAERNFREPGLDQIAEAIIWYNVEEETEDGDLKRDIRYPEEEIVTMRDSFDEGQTFVGIKAGNTVYAHSHLDAGSFVLDAQGKRWAFDLGQDNYNLYYKYNHWDVYRLRAEAHNNLIINPDATPGYVLGSRADVVEFITTPDRVKTVIRTTDLYGAERGVETSRRGYLFVDGRGSLVVRDEVKLTRESLLRWHLTTDADIEIEGNKATLRDKNNADRYVTVEFCCSAEFEIGAERALPLPTSPVIPEQNTNEGFYRLYLKTVADGEVSITAKINTRHTDTSPLADYNVSMDEWKI